MDNRKPQLLSKLAKRKSVDAESEPGVTSKDATEAKIDLLAARTKTTSGHHDKTLEMLFEMLRDFNRRLSALEK